MNADDIERIGTLVVTLIGAITALIVAIKQARMRAVVDDTSTQQAAMAQQQNQMQTVVDHTAKLTNSHNDALRALVQKQGNELHAAGQPPTQDDSIPLLPEEKPHAV